MRFLLLAAMSVSSVLSLSAGGFTDWTFESYENRLSGELRSLDSGRGLFLIKGPVEHADTAWSFTSPRFDVMPDCGSYRVRYEASAVRSFASSGCDAVEAGAWKGVVTWFDGSGRRIGQSPFPAMFLRGDFSRFEVSGPVLAGAAKVAFRFAGDFPDLAPEDSVALRGFELDFQQEKRILTTARVLKRGKSLPLDVRWKVGSSELIAAPQPDRDPGVRVTVRGDGFVVVDGEPYFPLGIYGVCKREFNDMDLDKAFADLQAAGFDLAHTYRDAYADGFMDFAWKYGFRLWVKSRNPSRQFLEVGRYHPAVVAWYVGDDTAGHELPEETFGYAAACRKADPYRLVCQADLLGDQAVSRYHDYVTATDIFMPELYPVRGAAGDPSDTNCVAAVVRDMRIIHDDIREGNDGRPRVCWPIIQAFKGWSKWRHYPTVEQIKAMSVASIVHGAQGLIWYTYEGFYNRKRDEYDQGITSTDERWQGMSDIVSLVRELRPALVSSEQCEQPQVIVEEGPSFDVYGSAAVTCLERRFAGTTYLIAVNSAASRVRAAFLLSDDRAAAEVMRENRSLPCARRKLTDVFEPLSVHVYIWRSKAHLWGTVAGCDSLERLHPRFARAFAFLRRKDLRTLKPGRYEIDGDDCWAMVQNCLLTPFGDIQKAEVHADFIDIQMPLDGPETYGLYTSDLEAFGPFDKCRDIGFADMRTQPLTLRYGEFAIFFSGSGAHAPCKTLGPKTMRKKLVIKVRK